MADYSTFAVAGSVEPLALPAVNTLLHDADPALFYGLDFWTYLINTFPGPRFLQAAQASGVSNTNGSPITSAVAQAYPWDPDLELLSNQFQFPLLAAYRKSSTFRRKTAGWENDRCLFDLIYVLPPLTAGQAEAVLPVFRAVAETIRHKTTQSFDPGYAPPGGSLGQTPWGLSFAGVEEIGFDRDSYGVWPGTGNLKFPFLLMSGYFVERDMYVPSTNKFAGGDITAALRAPDQTVINPFIQVSTQQAPTISSLSVTSGSVGGGTSVTLTGTLFLTGPAVLFGALPATNVVWNSATSITCSTPAYLNPGTIGVTVVNRDGQSGSLANSYTYTTP